VLAKRTELQNGIRGEGRGARGTAACCLFVFYAVPSCALYGHEKPKGHPHFCTTDVGWENPVRLPRAATVGRCRSEKVPLNRPRVVSQIYQRYYGKFCDTWICTIKALIKTYCSIPWIPCWFPVLPLVVNQGWTFNPCNRRVVIS
jgi:hypothetical protein